MREDLLAVIRPSHWSEISDFLGQPVNRIRETFRLYIQLLDQLGYALVRKGDPIPVAGAAPVSPADLIPWDSNRLYSAIEGAIMDATEQRLLAAQGKGPRVSDQAEVRMIVSAVEALLSGASAGT
jgi:hypothetical protein